MFSSSRNPEIIESYFCLSYSFKAWTMTSRVYCYLIENQLIQPHLHPVGPVWVRTWHEILVTAFIAELHLSKVLNPYHYFSLYMHLSGKDEIMQQFLITDGTEGNTVDLIHFNSFIFFGSLSCAKGALDCLMNTHSRLSSNYCCRLQNWFSSPTLQAFILQSTRSTRVSLYSACPLNGHAHVCISTFCICVSCVHAHRSSSFRSVDDWFSQDAVDKAVDERLLSTMKPELFFFGSLIYQEPVSGTTTPDIEHATPC